MEIYKPPAPAALDWRQQDIMKGPRLFCVGERRRERQRKGNKEKREKRE